MSQCSKIIRMKKHPGNIMILGKENKDIYVVNIFKMMVYKHLNFDVARFQSSI
jgi:hypothetical protein